MAPQANEQDAQEEMQPPAGMDWRIVVIIGLAALLLIAAYVNKKYFGEDQELQPVAKPVAEAPAGQEDPAQKPQQRMTPQEMHLRMIAQQQMVTMQSISTSQGRAFILGNPATPIRNPDNPQQVLSIQPGRQFEITRMPTGLAPQKLQRRPGLALRGYLYADNLAALGIDPNRKMVFKPAGEVTPEALADAERVAGIVVGGEARAYPLKFLLFHDVANDTVGGKPVAVCYSAFADAATAMLRTFKNGPQEPLVFGTTGLMFQTTNVLYDFATESLWWTAPSLCIAGQLLGQRLEPVQTSVTTWAAWKKLQPETSVLVGTEPGYPVDYNKSELLVPKGYLTNTMMIFPVYGFNFDTTPMRLKEPVFGVVAIADKKIKAQTYAINLLDKLEAGKQSFKDKLGEAEISLNYDRESGILTATGADGKKLFVQRMFWGAWFGMHPQTEVWQKQKLREQMVKANKAAMNALPPEQPAPPKEKH